MNDEAEMRGEAEVLTLGFLGQRAYLQGTTPLNALADRLTDAHTIHFQCRKVIFSDRVAARSGEGTLPQPAHWHAWLTWRDARGMHWIGIEPLPPSLQPAREPYDEKRLTQLATVDKDTVTLSAESPFPFVSTLVALNKFLLLSQPGERRAGQWLFTGLKLSRFPNEFLPLRLTIRQVLLGIAARTSVAIGEEGLGEIEFVWFAENLHTAPAG